MMLLIDDPRPSQLNHASSEYGPVPKFNDAGFPTLTRPLSPSKTNPCPDRPGPNVTPPCSVPSLPSTESLASPSALHRLTTPGRETIAPRPSSSLIVARIVNWSLDVPVGLSSRYKCVSLKPVVPAPYAKVPTVPSPQST